MDFKINWTIPAIKDLEVLVTFIAKDNPTAAEEVGLSIYNHVSVLETFPAITPIYAQAHGGDIRAILCEEYRIFYRIRKSTKIVDILHIRHGAMDEPDLNDLLGSWQ